MARLEHSADGHPKPLPADVALIQTGPRGNPIEQSDPGNLAAMYANRAIWPNDASRLRAGRSFIDETGLVENAWHRLGSLEHDSFKLKLSCSKAFGSEGDSRFRSKAT
jgi:hypothetical protein